MPKAQPFDYPYSLTGKVKHFPWKFHWQHGRMFRFVAYGILITLPLYIGIHKAANHPVNKKMWAEIRAARDHTFFDPPHE